MYKCFSEHCCLRRAEVEEEKKREEMYTFHCVLVRNQFATHMHIFFRQWH